MKENEYVQKIHELEQELKIRVEDNAELYTKLCNALMQLKEANEVIKITNRVSGNIDLSQMVYEDRRKVDGITMQTGSYLEKWGVK